MLDISLIPALNSIYELRASLETVRPGEHWQTYELFVGALIHVPELRHGLGVVAQ